MCSMCKLSPIEESNLWKASFAYELPLAIRLRGDLSNAASKDLRVAEASDALENKIQLRQIDNKAITGFRVFGPAA